ncbi:MAG: hypothetical protein MHM6MM_001749 [Cercozoa sp. M6MM]
MGAEQSTVATGRQLYPWSHENAHLGEEYPPATEAAIRRRVLSLSQSRIAFMTRRGEPEDAPTTEDSDSQIEQLMPRVQGLLQHDKRVALWFARLVPDELSEQEFWRNYWSHVRQCHRLQEPIYKIKQIEGPPREPTEPTDSESNESIESFEPTDSKQEDSSSDTFSDDDKEHTEDAIKDKEPAEQVDVEQVLRQSYLPRVCRQRTRHEAPIRWAIIGCGNVVIKHSGVSFLHAENSTLVGVLSTSATRVSQFRDSLRTHGVSDEVVEGIRAYRSLDELLADRRVDAVYVATRPDAHAAVAERLAAAQLPCLVEAPFARSFLETRAVLREFEKNNAPVFVAHQRRLEPRVQELRRVCREVLAPLHAVTWRFRSTAARVCDTADWRLNARCAGAGLWMQYAPHVLDVVRYLLPEDDVLSQLDGHCVRAPGVITEQSQEQLAPEWQVETTVCASFLTQGGIVGSILFDSMAPEQEQCDVLEITGAHGMARIALFDSDAPCQYRLHGQSAQEWRLGSAPTQVGAKALGE